MRHLKLLFNYKYHKSFKLCGGKLINSSNISTTCAHAEQQQSKEVDRETDNQLEAWQTVVLSTGAIACWHPQKAIPYEHSRPIDMKQVDIGKQKFFDRVHNPDKLEKWPYGEKGPEDLHLREIFYTNMQEWRPRPREKRLYKATAPIEQKPLLTNAIETASSPLFARNQQQQRLEEQQHQIASSDEEDQSKFEK